MNAVFKRLITIFSVISFSFCHLDKKEVILRYSRDVQQVNKPGASPSPDNFGP
jgi:hypothetical protein